jgi:hypothetical protein
LIRIIFILLLIFIAYVALRGMLKNTPALLAKYSRIVIWSAIGGILLLLMASGKLNAVFALVAVALASALRVLPIILNYFPHLHKLWAEYKSRQQNPSGQQYQKGDMSFEEAYEILGLTPSATEQDIIAAHRRLMLKNHPDRGGSDYLAAKINLAKKILLKK